MKSRLLKILSVTVGGLICSSVSAADPAASEWRVLQKYDVGGEGRWDYLTIDPRTRRLFVTRESHVMVIDADTGKTLGDIPDTQGIHGVALVPDLGRGFTSNGRAATATIFDLKTLKPIDSVKTGDNPDAICYEPTTKRVFTMNGRSHDATAIDAEAGKPVGKVELDGKPEFAVADGAGNLFINLEDKSEIVQVDAKELKVKNRWPIAPGEGPSGLAIDVKNHRLFSVCENKMMVVLDSETGKVVATPTIGERPDAAAFDPEKILAFSSNGDGTLTVIHEESPTEFKVLQNATTMRGARTMALDPKTHHIYLPTAKFESSPASGTGRGRNRPPMISGSFTILVVGQ